MLEPLSQGHSGKAGNSEFSASGGPTVGNSLPCSGGKFEHSHRHGDAEGCGNQAHKLCREKGLFVIHTPHRCMLERFVVNSHM